MKKDPGVKLRDFKRYAYNPFIDDIVYIKVGKKTVGVSRGSFAVDHPSGEGGRVSVDTAVLHIKKKVDRSQFLKLYTEKIRDIFELGECAIKIFIYLSSILEANSDQVIFDIDDCMKVTGYSSKKLIYWALGELTDRRFIARTKKLSMFYVNPAYIFNGDRLVLIEEYVNKDIIDETDKMIEERDERLALGERKMDPDWE